MINSFTFERNDSLASIFTRKTLPPAPPRFATPGENPIPGAEQSVTPVVDIEILYRTYLANDAKIKAEIEKKHMAIQAAVIDGFRTISEVKMITSNVGEDQACLYVYTDANYLEKVLLDKLLDVEISLMDSFPNQLFDINYDFYRPDLALGQPIIYYI